MSALVVCWSLSVESQLTNVSDVTLDKAQALGLRTLYRVSDAAQYPRLLHGTPGVLKVVRYRKGSFVAGAQAQACRDGSMENVLVGVYWKKMIWESTKEVTTGSDVIVVV